MSIVEIVSVDLDDSLIPFYTIKMPDGREKQTDDKHLSALENVVEGQGDAYPTQESMTNSEMRVGKGLTKLFSYACNLTDGRPINCMCWHKVISIYLMSFQFL